MPKGEYVAQRDESNFEGTCRVQILRSCSSWSSGIEREVHIDKYYFIEKRNNMGDEWMDQWSWVIYLLV